MNEQVAIDRITETENLTDNLEDQDANWLIDWGITQARQLIHGIKNEDKAGDKINAVMAVMRKLNEIAADHTSRPVEALTEDIRAFLDLYAKAFGKARTLRNDEIKDTAKALAQKSPGEVLQTLLDLAAPGTATIHR